MLVYCMRSNIPDRRAEAEGGRLEEEREERQPKQRRQQARGEGPRRRRLVEGPTSVAFVALVSLCLGCCWMVDY